jgi:hypothetical protein
MGSCRRHFSPDSQAEQAAATDSEVDGDVDGLRQLAKVGIGNSEKISPRCAESRFYMKNKNNSLAIYARNRTMVN